MGLGPSEVVDVAKATVFAVGGVSDAGDVQADDPVRGGKGQGGWTSVRVVRLLCFATVDNRGRDGGLTWARTRAARAKRRVVNIMMTMLGSSVVVIPVLPCYEPTLDRPTNSPFFSCILVSIARSREH